ncbi:AMP-binding protein [Caballeronia sordidicola]|uniref:Acyl-CoA synthetase, AMP-(Fatty) acid ligase / (3R)-hydroxymyristoyl-[ACP] dehydratase n=1 Tax=Caballeronia sordidicola TaxID=196367 RepID=A0A226X7R6_CABSO|nr:AMP-binding protein [Caballeronia sordidicola]OXC78878.1 Acyl-CoA synthetase, AMP-(fatty) acid ligase / (3R)-hydroxymyristoyl-[ACP] dehydratase [Caballeronia sordidicola]
MIALHDLLWAKRDAGTAVCRDGTDVLDFATFLARVRAIAARLSEQPARRYALCIDDPFHFACALFALFACGKEPVIPAHAAPGYLADLSNAYDAVLTDADMPAPASSSEYVGFLASIDPHAPLTLYTSGSTGTPKPIRKTLAQFNAEVHTLEAEWGMLVGDATVLGSVPHHHIYGLLFRVFWPLAAGRAFDRALSIEPQQLQARITQCRLGSSVVVSTPAQLSRWPELDGFASLSPAPRVFFSSGGPLAGDAARKYAEAFGAAPVEIYGSTETGGIAWRRQDQTDAWQALSGIEVHRGDGGTLNLRSPHLGHDDWHRTDDTIAVDPDGRFRLQGRLDRVIKLDGKRVSLPELEARLGLHPYVAQGAVVSLEGMSRERVGAVVALTDAGSKALLERGRVALAKVLRRHLAAYFDIVVLPRFWRFRFTLPFDARGKLPAAAVAAAFDACAHGVEVLSEVRSETALHYELRVPPTLVHFAGHFPGLPILPGVVQIDWVMRLAAEQVPGMRMLASIDQLKFKAPVPPGALLDLTLTHDASRRRVQFAYRLGRRECASGVIVYQGIA